MNSDHGSCAGKGPEKPELPGMPEKPPRNTVQQRARKWSGEPEKWFNRGQKAAMAMHNAFTEIVAAKEDDAEFPSGGVISSWVAYNAGIADYREQCKIKAQKGQKEVKT